MFIVHESIDYFSLDLEQKFMLLTHFVVVAKYSFRRMCKLIKVTVVVERRKVSVSYRSIEK